MISASPPVVLRIWQKSYVKSASVPLRYVQAEKDQDVIFQGSESAKLESHLARLTYRFEQAII
jgi:hypothetical protein